jgi:hypothetical protein
MVMRKSESSYMLLLLISRQRSAPIDDRVCGEDSVFVVVMILFENVKVLLRFHLSFCGSSACPAPALPFCSRYLFFGGGC